MDKINSKVKDFLDKKRAENNKIIARAIIFTINLFVVCLYSITIGVVFFFAQTSIVALYISKGMPISSLVLINGLLFVLFFVINIPLWDVILKNNGPGK